MLFREEYTSAESTISTYSSLPAPIRDPPRFVRFLVSRVVIASSYRKIPEVSSERALRIVRWRSAAAFLIRLVNVAVALLFVGTLAYFLVTIIWSVPDFIRMWSPPGTLSEEETWSLALLSLYPLIVVMGYVGMFILPIVLTLPLNAPIIGLWQYPPTFLFLRPFHRGVLSKPLKRIARREIAPLGHTYTLSDGDIHVPWFVRVPLVLGQLALFSFRFRTIRSFERLGALDRAMRRTWLRNVNWCMSWNKLFAVASTDDHWQAVVNLFLVRADVVFIDITDLHEHVVWEIERAHALGDTKRIVYLVDADQKVSATSKLASRLADSFDPVRLFAYDSHGLLEPDRFQLTLIDTLTSRDRLRLAGRSASLSVAATVLFVITLLPLTVLLYPLIDFTLLPLRVLLYPFMDTQSSFRWPRLPSVVAPTVIATIGFGLLALVLLGVAARSNRPIRFLLAVQTFLLVGAVAGLLEW